MQKNAEPPPLELIKVTKRFGSFIANDQVSMKVNPGTFHALVGENGAGKSTLVKCVMGYHSTDDGEIIVGSSVRQIRNPHDAHQLGVGMVYQHFTVVPAMSVAENLLLARTDLPLLINWASEYQRLADFLKVAPFQVDMQAKISDLAAGQKQKVEILKQLYLNCKILILDEPTSVLTPVEADEVLGMLHRMVKARQITVLIITHKFREVMTYCDDVTVLRKGKVTGQGEVKNLTASDLATMMMGEQRQGQTVQKKEQAAGEVRLEARKLKADRDNGVEGVAGIDFSVRSGEILGIAGVSGNGQRELVEVLGGQRPATGGEVRVNGELYRGTRPEIVRHQIYVLPEEPLRNACAPQMSVSENVALRSFDKPPLALGGWFLNQRAIRANGQKWITRFKVKTPGESAPIGNLSGGNVQRAVLARELGPGTAKVLITANPCFGLDFAAVDFINSQLLEARNKGVAILLISEDLDELLTLADRVMVMAEGKLVYEARVSEADVKTIGEKMAGH